MRCTHWSIWKPVSAWIRKTRCLPCQLWPKRMGGGPLRGGPVVRAGLSWGKRKSIWGSVSSRRKIINRVFIAELLCWVSLGLSARSQRWLMFSLCQGRRPCSVGVHHTAETADMARLAEPPALSSFPQGHPLTTSCPALACRSLCGHSMESSLTQLLPWAGSVFKVAVGHTNRLTYSVLKAGETFWSWWSFIQQVHSQLLFIKVACSLHFPVPWHWQWTKGHP